MQSLYEIKEEYLTILNNLQINEDGEIDNYEELMKISGEFNDKAEAIACFIKEEEATAEAIANEIKSLQERKKSHENKVENLKGYIASMMMEAKKDKIETGKVKLSFRKSASVSILDESQIPEWYKEEVVETKIKKKEIGEAFKAGSVVPGCEYVIKNNLQIK